MLASAPTARGVAAASCSSHEVRPCPSLNRVGRPGAQATALRPVACPQGAHSNLRAQRSVTSTRLNALVAVDPETAVATRPERPQGADQQVKVEGVFAVSVTKSVTCLRGICNERLKYEIEYGLKKGTSENAYLIQDKSGGKVLIDIPFKAFQDDFMRCLESQINPNELTHLIITHLGPNRIPTLVDVLRSAYHGRSGTPLTLVGTNPAMKALQDALTGDDRELLDRCILQVIKGSDDVIKVTPTFSLTPLTTPTPRWPDLMCVFDPNSKLLFTSKLFSAHVAPGLINDKAGSVAFDVGGWDAYGDHWRYFYECMLAPVAKQATAALDKLPVSATPRSNIDKPSQFLNSVLEVWGDLVNELTRGETRGTNGSSKAPKRTLFVSGLAPQHGPVVRTCLNQLVLQYRRWLEAQVEAASSSQVTVLYASAYGNTAALAQAISRGITKGGVAVNTINLEYASLEEVAAAVKASNGFVIGSPTLGGHMPTQVSLALGTVLRASSARELPCGVFGSFGWSGEAVDEMQAKLKDGGYSFAFNPIKVKFKPTAKDLMACEQSGRDLALSVKRKLKSKERSSTAGMNITSASGPQLAMGRVVGSMAVITAREEDATSAILASWISQASFDPPGLTTAIKKDRSIDDMLTPGTKFAVNMVPESKQRNIMKVMSTPVKPGEDRLRNLDTAEGPLSGCPILADSHAHMECEVIGKMDAGDHWVIYSTALGGKVADEGQQTAIIHRKVGNHY